MHSIQTLAHRAPPAARARARWQPYSALASAASSSSSRSPTLSTPATTVPPSPKPTPICDTASLKAQPSMPQLPKEAKNKYVTGLVDQAVNSLCEIWRPSDIPTIFLTSNKPTIGPEIPLPPRRTQPSFGPSSFSRNLQNEPDITSGLHKSNVVPMKGFVHEVLRRSRTSGSVLQTALCYLEAIRSRVPELVSKEQSGEGTFVRYDSETRIMPATPAELALEAQLSASSVADTTPEDVMDTVRVTYDDDVACTAAPSVASNDIDSALLPSPLLCPRRAFLASLILASKFTQDKCYSNRAWAKLSGLPAREISRCERALGDALDWRLWVGKTPSTTQATSTTVPAATRPLGRSQTEASLPSGKAPFLVQATTSSSAAKRPLRRSSTVPVEGFSLVEKGATSWAGHALSHANIAQQAEADASPMVESPATPSSTYSSSSQYSSSPIPPTPGLSYSPSSTESSSSSGDRTIQMSSFLDDAMGMTPAGCGLGGDGWGCSMVSPTLSGIAFEAGLRVNSGSAAAGLAASAFGTKNGPDGSWLGVGARYDYDFAKLGPYGSHLQVDYSVAVS
ncbi:hypothetical protein MKEN_00696200 [Mycena kentingensis (nom. inval.)]|nr:hypothetical protein MKEN_00696200 [Mycena kentingensis (nom. inval.)]